MRKTMLFVSAAAALVLAACSSDESATTGDGSTENEASTVDITLQEFAVLTSPATVTAGEVTFAITNAGEETHEFVIIKTELQAQDLPTEADGSVSESGEGMEVIDEVEDIPAGENAELIVDLEAGEFVLICNIVEEEDGESESHYQEGMRTGMTVN